ncbi:hypothetical protein [Mycobacterium pinniadriaticum]|uniref:Uncharacterized protein n=2 Tax=Mycobacterium pinniadriaticum TaxID=2994102 RepID=A0ABT3S7W4_9MYCO|nr:hypothetical protein [Mycobacterium pinniadriaticum]MCX2935591.1 hypothetical protein [Mycobacterium pinniadriaticum]
MALVCQTVTEAVAQVGGLICDRSLTGWDVRVFATHDEGGTDNDLALRIIGASRAEDLSEEPAADTLLRAVAVSESVYRDDPVVRRWVDEAMGEPLIEVLAWDSRGRDVRHVGIPVSRAAVVFLDHARAAVGCDTGSAASELYCQWRTGRIRQPLPRPNVLTTVNGG